MIVSKGISDIENGIIVWPSNLSEAENGNGFYEIRMRWPKVAERCVDAIENGRIGVGDIQLAQVGFGLYICNLLVGDNWEELDVCLEKVEIVWRAFGEPLVYFPYLPVKNHSDVCSTLMEYFPQAVFIM